MGTITLKASNGEQAKEGWKGLSCLGQAHGYQAEGWEAVDGKVLPTDTDALIVPSVGGE